MRLVFNCLKDSAKSWPRPRRTRKLISTIVMAACYAVAFAAYIRAEDKQKSKTVLREDLWSVRVSDGSYLEIYAFVESPRKRQDAAVEANYYPRFGSQPDKWSAHVTTIDYVPGMGSSYALVKVMEDRIFIFCLWNGQHVMLDRKDGGVVEKGKGDDVLKKFNCLVPLKLIVGPPSTGRHLSDDEWKELQREELEAARQTSAINLIQAIHGSKLYKRYVVQFDKTGLDRRPLVVIAWKARPDLEGTSVGLNHIHQDVPTISIDGHSVVPPRTKKAIHALQADYSLRQLPLSEDEITRLFSHITGSQERATYNDLNTFPPDPYWEQKVDPYLKVVEPRQKDTH